MVKKMLPVVLAFAAAGAQAQGIDEVKQHLYYDRVQSAETAVDKILQQENHPPEALYWATQVDLEKNDLADAKETLVKNNIHQGGNTERHPLSLVAWGEVLLREGDTSQAKDIFEDAIKQTKAKDPEVLAAVARANVYAARGNARYALDLLDKALRRDKKNSGLDELMGDAYRKLMDGGNAVKCYQAALQKNASYARAAYAIGKIYLTQNNSDLYLKYFNQAVAIDPSFAPALYELYYHYFYHHEADKAKEYLDRYIAHSDPSPEHKYMIADMLYIADKYDSAIKKANAIISEEGDKTQPRIYKMLAYCYDAKQDSVSAMDNIEKYFAKGKPGSFVVKDYELKGKLLSRVKGKETAAAQAYEAAEAADTVLAEKVDYMARIAHLYKKCGNRSNEARWLGKIYHAKAVPSNMDIYNWGLAHFAAQEYRQADSVFGLYITSYPQQVYGYYWRAKSDALIDTAMVQGMAVPYYEKVIELTAAKPQENKSMLMQAYGYIGAYAANIKKDYPAALKQFEQILALQPDDADAAHFRDILKKWVAEGKKN